jgi:hypothetical protein
MIGRSFCRLLTIDTLSCFQKYRLKVLEYYQTLILYQTRSRVYGVMRGPPLMYSSNLDADHIQLPGSKTVPGQPATRPSGCEP